MTPLKREDVMLLKPEGSGSMLWRLYNTQKVRCANHLDPGACLEIDSVGYSPDLLNQSAIWNGVSENLKDEPHKASGMILERIMLSLLLHS